MLLTLLQEAASELPAAEPHGLTKRAILLGIMVALPVAGILMVLVGGFRLRSILQRIKRISGRSELEVLRKEARIQGTMASLLKPMLGTANLLFLFDLFILGGPITDLVYSVVPSLISIAVSLPLRKYEQKIKELPCASEEIRQEWLKIQQG